MVADIGRRTPRQRRSKASVASIRVAAGRILVDSGFERFTTNAIAREAGVNIATLYQYYPDKYALLADLLDAFGAEAQTMVRGVIAAIPQPHRRIRPILENLVGLLEGHPWVLTITDAAHVMPSVAGVTTAARERIIGFVAETLPPGRGGLNFGASRPEHVIGLLAEIIIGGLRLALQAPAAERPGILDELDLLLNDYLDHYRGPAKTAG